MSKFDFFEEGVRRVLDNYELPLEENSWANFQAGLGAGNATNFLRAFVLPGLLVAGLFGAMHLGTPKAELSHHENSELSTTIHSENIYGSTELSSTDRLITEGNIANELDASQNGNAASNSNTSNTISKGSNDLISLSNEAQVLNNGSNASSKVSGTSTSLSTEVNSSLKETDSEEGLDKGPMKTKYEGSNYKLGAPTKFTPNNDNRDDTFMPPLLTKGSIFLMRIYDRGGNLVFETKDVHKPWDGTVLNTNKPAELGDYRWNVILDLDNKRKEYEGKVRLVR